MSDERLLVRAIAMRRLIDVLKRRPPNPPSREVPPAAAFITGVALAVLGSASINDWFKIPLWIFSYCCLIYSARCLFKPSKRVTTTVWMVGILTGIFVLWTPIANTIGEIRDSYINVPLLGIACGPSRVSPNNVDFIVIVDYNSPYVGRAAAHRWRGDRQSLICKLRDRSDKVLDQVVVSAPINFQENNIFEFQNFYNVSLLIGTLSPADSKTIEIVVENPNQCMTAIVAPETGQYVISGPDRTIRPTYFINETVLVGPNLGNRLTSMIYPGFPCSDDKSWKHRFDQAVLLQQQVQSM